MPVGPGDLGPWFRGRKRLIVAKGKEYQAHTLRGLSPQKRADLVLGPSGKLRAPALLVGETVLVGFHPEVYAETFG